MSLDRASCQVRVPADGSSPELTLEARFDLPGPDGTNDDAVAGAGAVVAPPHPVYGGTLANSVVSAAAEGLRRAGIATLLFNYRGTEASEGQLTDSLEAAARDYQAALAELRTRAPGPNLAAGYSFGAGVALLATRDDPRIKGAVLIAPPLGMLRAEDLTAFSGRLLVIVGDDDDYAPVPELTARLAVRPDAVLDVIPGADHFFHFGGLAAISARVAEHVRGWL